MKRFTSMNLRPVKVAARNLSAGAVALVLATTGASSAHADEAPPSDTPTETPNDTPSDTPTDSGTTAPMAPVEPANNIVQVELSTGALIGISLSAVSLSYERVIGDNFSVRVGYGLVGGRRDKFGLGGGDRSQIRGHGGYAMVHAFFGDDHKLELGAGVAVVLHERDTNHANGDTSESSGTMVTPQASVGYRYQPEGSGIFFRAGIVWTLGWGTPLGLGLGYSF